MENKFSQDSGDNGGGGGGGGGEAEGRGETREHKGKRGGFRTLKGKETGEMGQGRSLVFVFPIMSRVNRLTITDSRRIDGGEGGDWKGGGKGRRLKWRHWGGGRGGGTKRTFHKTPNNTHNVHSRCVQDKAEVGRFRKMVHVLRK